MIQANILSVYNSSRQLDKHAGQPRLCYAPWTSLYFGQQGKVIACALNRTQVLGKYPENSISDIWNGQAIDRLRKSIDSGDLINCGCQECAYQLKARNFSGIKTRMFDHPYQNRKSNNYPSLLEFEIDNTCNLECVMCSGMFSSSIRKNREQLPPIKSPYDEAFVKQLREFVPHISQAHFFGGEPFLVPIHYHIWDAIAELNPNAELWVITNGTILNEKVKELLHKLRFNITFSIDSFNPPNYEKIRVNSQFDKVMKHFRYFYEYTKVNGQQFTINSVYMQSNWQDVPQTVSKCNILGIPLNLIPVIHPKKMSLSLLLSKELKEIVQYLEGFSFGVFDAISERNFQQYQSMLQQVKEWEERSRNIEKVPVSGSKYDKGAVLEKSKVVIEALTASIEPNRQEGERKRAFATITSKISQLESFWAAIDPLLIDAFATITSHTNPEQYVEMLLTNSVEELVKITTYTIVQEMLKMFGQLPKATIHRLVTKAEMIENRDFSPKPNSYELYCEAIVQLFALKGLDIQPHMKYALKMQKAEN